MRLQHIGPLEIADSRTLRSAAPFFIGVYLLIKGDPCAYRDDSVDQSLLPMRELLTRVYSSRANWITTLLNGVLYVCRNFRQEVVLRYSFDVPNCGHKRLPSSTSNALLVPHANRNCARALSDPVEVVISFGQNYDYFPKSLWNVHLPASYRRGCTLRSLSASTKSARDYVKLVSLARQVPLEVFKLHPRPLVIVGCLREYVCHKEGRVVVRPCIGSVLRITDMATIKSTVVVIRLLYLLEASGQAIVWMKIAA